MVVVGGFLGAGKTTLLNSLLCQPGLPPRCVLVNDFGALQIDASLISESNDDVIELADGCICCSLGDDLTRRLVDIAERAHPPSLLLIEASGVSDPLRIAQVGLLDRAFRLNAVVVAVDAEHFEHHLADRRLGDMARTQVAGASVLALTHLEGIPPGQVGQLRSILARINPRAPVFDAPKGRLPPAVFLDQSDAPRAFGESWTVSSEAPLRAHPPSHAEISSLVFHPAVAVEPHRLRRALGALPAQVLRVKGFVHLQGRPGKWLVQMVCARLTLTRAPEETSTLGLVLLGCFDHAEREALIAHLEEALA